MSAIHLAVDGMKIPASGKAVASACRPEGQSGKTYAVSKTGSEVTCQRCQRAAAFLVAEAAEAASRKAEREAKKKSPAPAAETVETVIILDEPEGDGKKPRASRRLPVTEGSAVRFRSGGKPVEGTVVAVFDTDGKARARVHTVAGDEVTRFARELTVLKGGR